MKAQLRLVTMALLAGGVLLSGCNTQPKQVTTETGAVISPGMIGNAFGLWVQSKGNAGTTYHGFVPLEAIHKTKEMAVLGVSITDENGAKKQPSAAELAVAERKIWQDATSATVAAKPRP